MGRTRTGFPWNSPPGRKARRAASDRSGTPSLESGSTPFPTGTGRDNPHSGGCVRCGLLYRGVAWYLQAYCLDRQAYRLFKLTRMGEGQLLKETFGPLPPIPQPAEQPLPFTPTILRFHPAAAHRVYDAL